jgi:hypothetical protein
MDWCPIDSVVLEWSGVARSQVVAVFWPSFPLYFFLESVSSGRVICAPPGYMKRVGARA